MKLTLALKTLAELEGHLDKMRVGGDAAFYAVLTHIGYSNNPAEDNFWEVRVFSRFDSAGKPHPDEVVSVLADVHTVQEVTSGEEVPVIGLAMDMATVRFRQVSGCGTALYHLFSVEDDISPAEIRDILRAGIIYMNKNAIGPAKIVRDGTSFYISSVAQSDMMPAPVEKGGAPFYNEDKSAPTVAQILNIIHIYKPIGRAADLMKELRPIALTHDNVNQIVGVLSVYLFRGTKE